MTNGSFRRLESKSGIYLVIFLGILVLALFYFLWLQPLIKVSDRLDRQIAGLELDNEKQKRLTPVYLKLENREFPTVAEALVVPERGSLPEVEIASIIPFMRKLALDAGMIMESVNPQLGTLESTPGYLAVDVDMRGNYLAFREFIFAVARLPYFNGIETINIRQVGRTADDKRVQMKVWLSIG